MTDLEVALRDSLERQFSKKGAPVERTPGNLAEAIRYSLLSPGKRIRPRLTLACGKMLGLSEAAVLPAALAIEMIHCFTLIHDDLPCMDDDDFRRGRPSNHKTYGEALALLAGDALIPVAIDAYSEALSHVKPELWIRGLARLTTASGPRGVIGGQAAEALVQATPRLEDMNVMHAQKTGALFAATILIPMELAGIAETSEKGRALERFSREIGAAFQIADDLEDASEGEKPSPTSILFYRPESEARRDALRRLRDATADLEKNWPSARENLSPFAAEIARKLEKA